MSLGIPSNSHEFGDYFSFIDYYRNPARAMWSLAMGVMGVYWLVD